MAEDKASKKEAAYKLPSPDPTHHCGNCTMFRKPHGCTAVEGIIYFMGICKYYKEKK